MLGTEWSQVLLDVLHKKLSNKVLENEGLCLAVQQLLRADEPYIFPGSKGKVTCSVQFTMVMFRPVLDQVIIAVVHSTDASGIALSLGFFSDIFVPGDMLPEGSIL